MMMSLFFLTLFFLLILTIDFFSDFWIWQNRIKIGRYTNQKEWEKKILAKSLSWLNVMPKTKVKDENKLIVLDILNNKYTNKTLQSWQEASLLLGLNKAYQKNENPKIKYEILKFVNSKIDKQGNWIVEPKEVDTALLAFAISEIPFLSREIKPALDSIYQLILSKIGEDGTIMYRNTTHNYRYVDTIGFICPFLTKYGIEFQKEEAIHLAVSQIKNYFKFMPQFIAEIVYIKLQVFCYCILFKSIRACILTSTYKSKQPKMGKCVIVFRHLDPSSPTSCR